MSKSVSIILLLLCTSGFLCSAYGADSKEQSSKEVTSSGSDGSSSGGGTLRLPLALIRITFKVGKNVFNVFVTYGRPVIRGLVSLLLDTLSFLFSSNDKRMVRRRRSTDDYDGNGQENNGGGGGLASILSEAFMSPFKLIFGTVRRISIKTLVQDAKSLLTPVDNILHSPAAETLANATMVVVDYAVSQLWNFTKSSVFPRVDTAITNLVDSDALPSSVDTYLKELQTLYHILRTLGVV